MQHKSWLILNSILLSCLIGGAIVTNPQVQARRVHKVRQVKIHRRRMHRYQLSNVDSVIKIPKSVYPADLLDYTNADGQTGYTGSYFKKYQSTRMSKCYIRAVVKNEYQAINHYRQQQGCRPLTKNRLLTKLADWRAKQASRDFTHYNRSGQVLARLDAVKMRLGSYRYNSKNIGENMFSAGKWSRVQLNNGVTTGTAIYFFKDPWALAGDNVFDSLNNDADSQWAHGQNIMTPQFRYIGIGTYYRKSSRCLYVLVEFSVKKPVVHRK